MSSDQLFVDSQAEEAPQDTLVSGCPDCAAGHVVSSRN
jgi:hypothetical protein